MDNLGTPAPSNFHIRTYVEHQKIQDPSKCWPFGEICEYSRNIDLSCRVPLSNRRGRKIVEAPESSARRNTEADNVVDENHRAISIDISRGSETDSGNDAAYEAERRRKGKVVAHEIPSANEAERRRIGKAVAHEIPSDIEMDFPSGSETDSEDDAGAELEYDRQLNVAILESLKSYNTNIVGQNLNTHALRTVTGLSGDIEMDFPGGSETASEDDAGAEIEYERQLNVAILESLESYHNSGLARGNVGNIGNDSASNSLMELANVPSCRNEDSVDEGAQIEALDAVRGTFINCSIDSDHIGRTISKTEPTDSMPRPGLSSRGRLLKPTHKLLQLANATDAPAGKGTCGSKQEQSKKRRLNATIALGRSSGSGSVVGQDSGVNGVARQADVVNLDGSGVGGSGPTEPTSATGQASGANAVDHQTDMLVPFLEPMVCVTNRNPMDLTIEEAKKYMRTE